MDSVILDGSCGKLLSLKSVIKVPILVNKSGALSISLVALVAEAVSVSAVENETLALEIASDFISGN